MINVLKPEERTPENLGRFAILIENNGSPKAPRWIPETEAQAILKQLGDFDPAAQPLAFQDLIQKRERDAEKLIEQKESLNHRIDKKTGNSNQTTGNKTLSNSSDSPKANLWPWLAGLMALILFALGIFLKNEVRDGSYLLRETLI